MSLYDLTQDKLSKVFEFDGQVLWRRPYKGANNKTYCRKQIYSISNTSSGYCDVRFNNKMIRYHTIVWILTYGAIPKNMYIDHIDGNKTNNHIDNLRLVTNRQNSQNRKRHREGALVGATYDKNNKSWCARARSNKILIHIGRFKTEQEAHEAYLQFISNASI